MTTSPAPSPGHRADQFDLASAGRAEMKSVTIRSRLVEARVLSLLGLLCLPLAWSGVGLSDAVASTDDATEESAGSHSVPYFPSASDEVREGFVRVNGRPQSTY